MAIKIPEYISGLEFETEVEKILSYENLRSEEGIAHLKRALTSQDDEIITYYIHNNEGTEYLGSYQYTNSDWSVFPIENQIETLNHNDFEISFTMNIFEKLDPLIDLDFRKMNNFNGSAIDIYSVSSFDDETDLNVLGMSIKQTSNMGSWWDVIWKNTDSTETYNDNDLNTIIHEIGHALGLSHPFNDPENEQWSTEDTVMSYNEGPEGWNTWFSKLDILALQSIWGRENDQGFINIDDLSSNFEFLKTGKDTYNIKGDIGVEDITLLEKINFKDKTFAVEDDIKNTFNLIEGVDDITGQLFRLYNTILDRFPDKSGLNYWINMNKRGLVDLKITSELFMGSEEFLNLYGSNITNENLINQIYLNSLNREPELDGFEYWLNQLESNLLDKADFALSINNSSESRFLFMKNTGTTHLGTLSVENY